MRQNSLRAERRAIEAAGTLEAVGRAAREHVERAFALEVFGERLEQHLNAVT